MIVAAWYRSISQSIAHLWESIAHASVPISDVFYYLWFVTPI
jgi:hypothetical protein